MASKKLKPSIILDPLIALALIVTAVSTLIAYVNPQKQLAYRSHLRRQHDIDRILWAVNSYQKDNGSLPSGISTLETQIGTCTSGGQKLCPHAQSACLDLSAPLSKYLSELPHDDQSSGSTDFTGYSIFVDDKNIVTVKSCLSDGYFTYASL
jgi:hypothetical protein